MKTIFKYVSIFIFIISLLACGNNSGSSENINSSYNTEDSESENIESELETNFEEFEDEENSEDSDEYDLEEEEEEELYPDDTYCAEVEYYNPNTGTSSVYTLTVEVENNEVVQLNFPNGWMDEDQFNSSELDEDGITSFTSDKGYEYEVRIIGRESGCFIAVPMAKQCRGETEEGEQCEILTDNPNGLCWQHQDQE